MAAADIADPIPEAGVIAPVQPAEYPTQAAISDPMIRFRVVTRSTGGDVVFSLERSAGSRNIGWTPTV